MSDKVVASNPPSSRLLHQIYTDKFANKFSYFTDSGNTLLSSPDVSSSFSCYEINGVNLIQFSLIFLSKCQVTE